MSQRAQAVPRPIKKGEFTIVFATRHAEVGWRDLLATQRNATVDAWDFLTRSPDARTPINYRLKGDLATVVHGGTTHDRWQHKLSGGGADLVLRRRPERLPGRRAHSASERDQITQVMPPRARARREDDRLGSVARYALAMSLSSPEERLRVALDLADLGEQMMRARLRREQPDLDDAGLQAAIERWRQDRPGAPLGDCPGRPYPRPLGSPGR